MLDKAKGLRQERRHYAKIRLEFLTMAEHMKAKTPTKSVRTVVGTKAVVRLPARRL
jgi:hypothetical protein